MDLITSTEERFQQCLNTMASKNHDYTGNQGELHNFNAVELLNITDRDTGLIVRMTDKFTRIVSLLENQAQVKDETIQDTINDFINYLAILGYSLQSKDSTHKTENSSTIEADSEDIEEFINMCANIVKKMRDVGI